MEVVFKVLQVISAILTLKLQEMNLIQKIMMKTELKMKAEIAVLVDLFRARIT
jgi:hypothetical protein